MFPLAAARMPPTQLELFPCADTMATPVTPPSRLTWRDTTTSWGLQWRQGQLGLPASCHRKRREEHRVVAPQRRRGRAPLFDWACTHSYVRACADALELPLYFSYKQGGFEREMLRKDAPTAPIYFETPEGARTTGGTSGKLGTRQKFPQISADLFVRWCSAYLKIDVASSALRNQDRFIGKRTLFVTGERAEESTARAKYATFEKHRTDTRDGTKRSRHVDHWRPVHGWSASAVWAILERHRIQYHPAYGLGFGRYSCGKCVFGSPDQWASAAVIDPAGVATLITYEEAFGVTMRRGETLEATVARGTPYKMSDELLAAARSTEWSLPIIMAPGAWVLPAGAFGDASGPP